MTTEATTTRKNTDYSASAVNLTNPPDVIRALGDLLTVQAKLTDVTTRIALTVPKELSDEANALTSEIADRKKKLETLIDQWGGYQDLETGHYALKQRKVSKSYNAEKFEPVWPQYSQAVIIKAIDEAKLKGLIKGGLITEDELKANQVLTEKESFAFIIK